ncbi:MAG: DivIVA domain-containing protein [Candidatus Nanopelagicales bacterium]|nr:DivIVA domain-containing protein [Candidatus Nanopelagicales bacterium]
MTLSAQDVRDARFGTTRIRAGYNMAEVDAFLDQVEGTITLTSSEGQRLGDEVEALRSQVQQLQGRLAAAQRELQDAQSTPIASPDEGHATVITPTDDGASAATVQNLDGASTTENVVVGDVSPVNGESLAVIRDRVREMLTQQLALVDDLDIDASAESPRP